MREFGIIQDKFPGADDVYKDWAEASIANLSEEQRDKLFGILNAVTIDGEVTDVWDQIPETQRKDIEMGIQYVLKQGYSTDLILGRWAKKHTGGGWEETVGDASFWEKYNLLAKPSDKPIAGSSNILLILRVSPTGSHAARIVPELLELPSFSGSRHAMLPHDMVFHKELDAKGFLEQLDIHKDDLSIAA